MNLLLVVPVAGGQPLLGILAGQLELRAKAVVGIPAARKGNQIILSSRKQQSGCSLKTKIFFIFCMSFIRQIYTLNAKEGGIFHKNNIFENKKYREFAKTALTWLPSRPFPSPPPPPPWPSPRPSAPPPALRGARRRGTGGRRSPRTCRGLEKRTKIL